MTTNIPTVDLDLFTKLQDRDYRRRFFLAETSRQIAQQLIGLRKLRNLTQADLAKLAKTGQPAISRAEQADYHNRSFNTLRCLAEAMDARIRVSIEPAEKVLHEYKFEAQSRSAELLPKNMDFSDLLAEIYARPARQGAVSDLTHGVSRQAYAASAATDSAQHIGPSLSEAQPVSPPRASSIREPQGVGAAWN